MSLVELTIKNIEKYNLLREFIISFHVEFIQFWFSFRTISYFYHRDTYFHLKKKKQKVFLHQFFMTCVQRYLIYT